MSIRFDGRVGANSQHDPRPTHALPAVAPRGARGAHSSAEESSRTSAGKTHVQRFDGDCPSTQSAKDKDIRKTITTKITAYQDAVNDLDVSHELNEVGCDQPILK